MHTDPRRLRELEPSEALRRLASVPMGRVVFTKNALPSIHPVNHDVIDGDVIIRCHEGALLLSAANQVVAFGADDVDPVTRHGWTAFVTGPATIVEDDEARRYQPLLGSAVDPQLVHILRIRSEMVTGYEVGPVADAVPLGS